MEQNKDLKERYNYQSWEQQIEKNIFIWNYFMTGTEFPDLKLIRTTPEQYVADNRVQQYIWQGKESEEVLILLDIISCSSQEAARQMLLEILDQHEAPQLPEGKERNAGVGDIGFTSLAKGNYLSLFARGNMVIRVQNGGKELLDVSGLARTIDKQFADSPELRKHPGIPEILAFFPEKETAQINESVGLNIQVRELFERPVWYRFSLDHGEIIYKGEELRFYAKKPGTGNINFQAINENGPSVAKEVSVRVE